TDWLVYATPPAQTGQSTLRLSSEHISQDKPYICRTLRKPTHKIRIPIPSVRYVDPHPITLCHQLFLEVPPDAVQHLKFKSVRRDIPFSCKLYGGVDHVFIVRGDAVVKPRCQQKFHDFDVVRVNIALIWKCNRGRFFICPLTQPYPRAQLKQFCSVLLGAVKIGLNNNSHVFEFRSQTLEYF